MRNVEMSSPRALRRDIPKKKWLEFTEIMLISRQPHGFCTNFKKHEMPNNRKQRELTKDEVKQIVSFLLTKVIPDTNPPALRRGALAEAAKLIEARQINPTTAKRIWTRAQQNFQTEGVFFASPKKKTGRKRKFPLDSDGYLLMQAEIASLKHEGKRSLRSIASAIKLPTTTLWRYKQWSQEELDDPLITPGSVTK